MKSYIAREENRVGEDTITFNKQFPRVILNKINI